MTNQVDNLKNAVVAKLTARAEAALKDDNKSLHKKFMHEAKSFTTAYAQAMHDNSITADFCDTIAIYAMQKVRKLLNVINRGDINSADQFTLHVLANAKHNKWGDLNAHEQNMSLSASIDADGKTTNNIRYRRHKAPSTATTQASSTRKALAALTIANENADDSLTFNVDSESALVKKFYELAGTITAKNLKA